MASSSSNHVGPSSSTGNRLMPSLSNPGDIAVWLHNKLSSDDIWSDKSSIISQLNADMLTTIKSCFTELQLNVKLKLLLSFLHLPKRNLDDWKNELEDLIRIATNDSDPWVSVVAELLENYPRHGSIDLDPTSSSFSELSSELKKLVKKQDQKILPLESLFLNRWAFHSQFGQPAQPVKHFQLKRKAKSATLRAELLQKATDLSSGRRPSTGPTVPIRCRGLNSSDSTPYKGIPSRNNFGSYSNSFKSGLSRLSSTPGGYAGGSRSARLAASNIGSSGMKRDGGIVLLDIYEAPSATNQRDLKRQRKDKEKEKQQEKSEKQQQQASSSATSSTTPTVTLSSSNISITKLTSTSSIDDDHFVERQSFQQKSDDSTTKTNITTTPLQASRNSLLNRNDSVDNGNESTVIRTATIQSVVQENLSKFQNTKNVDNIIPSQQSHSQPQNSLMSNTSNQLPSFNQQRQILASKSTPDYAAGLTPVQSTSVITTAPTNLKMTDSRINQQMSSIESTPVQSLTQSSSSLYHEQQPQQQQQQSSPLKTTTQSMYQQNQNSSNQFNNNQQQQQQQPQITNIRTPAGSSQFTMLNQSLMAQRSQSKQQQQPQQSDIRVPLQQQMLAYQQQQQNRNSNFTSNVQQLQQNPYRNLPQQSQTSPSTQQFAQQGRPTPSSFGQQNRPQSQQQAFQTSFGMYDGPPPPSQQQQQQPRLPQSTLSLQGLSPSAEQLMREITNKFPHLNPQILKTIYDFLNGCPNPSPELGPQRQFRLGETIELRKRLPDQPETRLIVETQLLIDYDKKTCKKLENLKTLPDFRTVGIVGNPHQQQQFNLQSGQGGGMPIRMFQTVGPRGGLSTVVGTPRMMMTSNRAGVPVTFMAINPSFLQQSQQQHQQQQQQQQQVPSTTGNQSPTTPAMQYSHLQQRV